MSFRMTAQATGAMNQLQQQMDITAHNLANSNTTGYKERQVEFSELMSQHLNNLTPAAQTGPRLTPDGIREGIGARLGAVNSNTQLGSIQETDRDLDSVLLNEQHYFQVQVEENGQQEIQYTRDGSFYLQPVANGTDMMLVTSEGHPVQGTNGVIQFSADQVDHLQIAENGDIIVQRAGENEVVGSLAITNIPMSRSLETVGENRFRVPEGIEIEGIAQAVQGEDRMLQSGALEQSNVSTQEQMTQLISAQRAYQFNARTVTMSDQMQGLINQLR